jgi:hypothetical protein
MPNEDSEFQKLLSEAPMAPSSDTLTVVGALSRSADPTRFVLTLPNGQSETVEVAAVKSARKIAGAIGQSLVELELDAKRVPEKVIDIVNKRAVSDIVNQTIWYQDPINTGTGLEDRHLSVPPVNDTLAETILGGAPVVPPPAPFAAAMPHQASLGQHPQVLKKPPHIDLYVPPKGPSQDGTNAWNGLDITGIGGFDIITWQNGQPIYYYS